MKKLVLMLVLLASAAHAQTQPATVIVVRHAEKADVPTDNPRLSAEGWVRVEQLIEAVRNAGITAIYSTPYTRTLDTAGGVAKALGIGVIETPIPNRNVQAYAANVAARVRRDGGVILVVGHSNTMGAVIKALGGPDIGEIADPRYDDLFVLTVQDGKPTRIVRSKFGVRWEPVTKP